MLREWDKLPEYMRTEAVRPYYDSLKRKKISLILKRVFDLTVAILMLIFLLPLLVVIAILIAIDSKGGIFFRQERITQYGRKFKIIKFRTMVANSDQIGSPITIQGDERITRLGRVLRKYRLDEVPQLINIIRGDMSFCGTRPESTCYVKKYSQEMFATLLLPAGVTSEASIRYKNEADLLKGTTDVDRVYIKQVLPGKMAYNLRAIEKFSFFGEIATMFRTIFAVLEKGCPQKQLIAMITNNDDDIYCFRKELIEGLIEEGYYILISCPYGPKFELMKDIPYIYDNPVIDRRGTNILADSKLFLHYRKLFKKYKPSVVLTYTAKPNVYAGVAAALLGIPYINNVTGLGSVLNKNGLMKAFIMAMFKNAYKRAACIMFQNSANMRLALDSGMIKGEYQLIPGSGVDTKRYPLQPYPNGGNGIDGDTIVFNYIGRILHDKGVDDYIEAAKQIRRKYPNTEFNMIGFIEPTEIHYEKELTELGRLGIVKYCGSQKDVRPFIAKAHAIIHPSTYGEGMSNVLLENASSGRFIITTDNPGCRETVINEKTGLIYHGGNVDDLVKKIEQFLVLDNRVRKSMGQAGRQYVKENFSRSIVVEAYKKKIKEILGR